MQVLIALAIFFAFLLAFEIYDFLEAWFEAKTAELKKRKRDAGS